MAKRVGGSPPSEPTLPVTPMLDMTFQLMFFFIATYKPVTALEGQIEMALPSVRTDIAAQTQAQVQPKESHKDEVDVPAYFTIKIQSERGPDARNPGMIRFLTVVNDAGKEEFQVDQTDEDQARVRVKDMFAKIRKKLSDTKNNRVKKDNEKDTVRVEADGNTKWGEVMQVIDLCNELGFQVSFIPPPPE